MNIAIICFSMTGLETGEKLKKALTEEGEQVTLAKKSRYLPDSIAVSTSQWAGEQFRSGKDGVIFIGACGIAVRSIAPYIVGKKTDPAVLVIDECGNFVSPFFPVIWAEPMSWQLAVPGYLGATAGRHHGDRSSQPLCSRCFCKKERLCHLSYESS